MAGVDSLTKYSIAPISDETMKLGIIYLKNGNYW